MTDPWVCIDCGARQAAEGPCRTCNHELTSDARDERVRELMRDVDLRLRLRRETRCRYIGVAVGLSLVVGLWVLVPGFLAQRGKAYPGLPFFADQWLLMVAIGFGVSKLLEKRFNRARFPYLRLDLTIEDAPAVAVTDGPPSAPGSPR